MSEPAAAKPRWREDFPVRWDEDNYMTRRELAKFLTLGSGLLASVNVLIAFIGLTHRPSAARRIPALPVSNGRGPVHPAARCVRALRCLLAGLHASVVRPRAPAG